VTRFFLVFAEVGDDRSICPGWKPSLSTFKKKINGSSVISLPQVIFLVTFSTLFYSFWLLDSSSRK
jgi:hypothetical protein